MSASDQIQYFVFAEFLVKDKKWLPSRITFTPTSSADKSVVITIRKELWGPFSLDDIQLNLAMHSINAFVDEKVLGREIEIDLNDLECYLKKQFNYTNLKMLNNCDSKLATHSVATFMFLQPILPNVIMYVGHEYNMEKEHIKQSIE